MLSLQKGCLVMRTVATSPNALRLPSRRPSQYRTDWNRTTLVGERGPNTLYSLHFIERNECDEKVLVGGDVSLSGGRVCHLI